MWFPVKKKSNPGSGWNRGISGLISQYADMMSFNKKYRGQYDNTNNQEIYWELYYGH